MPDVLSSAIPYLFADDTKCLHMHKHTTSKSTLNQTLLPNDINALFDYANSWHLFLIILSVHTCIFISIQVQILLLTTSIIWKYPKN